MLPPTGCNITLACAPHMCMSFEDLPHVLFSSQANVPVVNMWLYGCRMISVGTGSSHIDALTKHLSSLVTVISIMICHDPYRSLLSWPSTAEYRMMKLKKHIGRMQNPVARNNEKTSATKPTWAGARKPASPRLSGRLSRCWRSKRLLLRLCLCRLLRRF